MSDDLKAQFERSPVPAPRVDLADRIVRAATTQAPLQAANDRKPWALSALGGIAATLVAGFFIMTTQADETELWAEQADLAGYSDLYAWVYGEDPEAAQ